MGPSASNTHILLQDIEWNYINLDSRPDRRDQVERQFAKMSLDVHRFPAFRSQDWNGPKDEVSLMRKAAGAIGCYMSHLMMFDKAATTRRTIGVFEDDVLFCDDFFDRFRYIEEKFNKPWDIFFLNSTYHCNPPYVHKTTLGRDFEQTDIKYIHRVYGLFCTHAYIINHNSAETMLHLMRANAHRIDAVDGLLGLLQPQLNCYCFTPGMVFQVDGKSDVTGKIRKLSRFIKLLGPYAWAQRLEDFDYDSFDWAEGQQTR